MTGPTGTPGGSSSPDDATRAYAPQGAYPPAAPYGEGTNPPRQVSYGAPPPVQPVPARRGPSRWIFALVGVVLLAAVAGGALLIANRGGTGSSTGTSATGYLPGDAIMYGELRLDRPGDQRQALADFMSKFPGWDDRANFDTKLDTAFDRLFGEATEQKVSWTNDIKPWFGGQLTMAAAAPAGPEQQPNALVVLSVTDKAKAEAFLTRVRGEATEGVSYTSEDHRGTTVWSAANASGASGPAGAYAVTNDAVLVGAGATDIKAAIDRKAGTGTSLAGNAAFTDAMKKLRADRLGALWIDIAGVRTIVERQAAENPALASIKPMLAQLPKAMAGEIHFGADQGVIELRAIGVPAEMRPTVGKSRVVTRLPKGALAYVEIHDVGRTIRTTIQQLKAQIPAGEGPSPFEQLEQFLGADPETAFDWATDAGLSVSFAGAPSFGLVLLTADEAAATQRMNALVQNLRDLSPEMVTETDYKGTKITTISGGSGGGGPVPMALSYAIRDGAVLMGLGQAFVQQLIDLQEADSLANDERFKAALAAAGSDTTGGIMYADMRGIRTTAEQLYSTFGGQPLPEQYTRDIRPYLEPLDLLVATTTMDGEDGIVRLVVTVKK